MENESREEGSILVHSMGLDYVELIDCANNKNAVFIKFRHNDNNVDKLNKINTGKERLLQDRNRAYPKRITVNRKYPTTYRVFLCIIYAYPIFST